MRLCEKKECHNLTHFLIWSSRDSQALAPNMIDWDGNPEHEEPTGTIDDDIQTIRRKMTPAHKYFPCFQSTSNNKLALDPELKFLPTVDASMRDK
jgi:hypothetical protein